MMMRIVRGVLAVLLLVAGLPLLLAGVLLWLAMQHRDPGGAYRAPLSQVTAHGPAIVVPDIDALVRRDADIPGLLREATRFRLTASTAEGPAFIGLAPPAAAARYLAGVAHTTIDQVRLARGPLPVTGTAVPGPALRAEPPAAQTFWTRSATGAVEWAPGQHLTLIVMNPSGHGAIAADMTAEVRPALLAPATFNALVLGTLLTLCGIATLAWPTRTRDIIYVVEPAQLPALAARLGTTVPPGAVAQPPAQRTDGSAPPIHEPRARYGADTERPPAASPAIAGGGLPKWPLGSPPGSAPAAPSPASSVATASAGPDEDAEPDADAAPATGGAGAVSGVARTPGSTRSKGGGTAGGTRAARGAPAGLAESASAEAGRADTVANNANPARSGAAERVAMADAAGSAVRADAAVVDVAAADGAMADVVRADAAVTGVAMADAANVDAVRAGAADGGRSRRGADTVPAAHAATAVDAALTARGEGRPATLADALATAPTAKKRRPAGALGVPADLGGLVLGAAANAAPGTLGGAAPAAARPGGAVGDAARPGGAVGDAARPGEAGTDGTEAAAGSRPGRQRGRTAGAPRTAAKSTRSPAAPVAPAAAGATAAPASTAAPAVDAVPPASGTPAGSAVSPAGAVSPASGVPAASAAPPAGAAGGAGSARGEAAAPAVTAVRTMTSAGSGAGSGTHAVPPPVTRAEDGAPAAKEGQAAAGSVANEGGDVAPGRRKRAARRAAVEPSHVPSFGPAAAGGQGARTGLTVAGPSAPAPGVRP